MNWSERLEQLLLETDFDHLDDQDRAWLLQEGIDEQQYRQWQQILHQGKRWFAESLPVPNRIEDQLRQRFRQIHQTESAVGPNVPIWAWAAALVGVFFLGRWTHSPTPPAQPTSSTVIVHKIDTVFIDRMVEKEIEVLVEVPVFIDKPNPIGTDDQPDTVQLQMPEVLPIATLPPTPAKGRTARDEARLLELVVEMY